MIPERIANDCTIRVIELRRPLEYVSEISRHRRSFSINTLLPGPVDVSAYWDALGCSWPHFVLRSGEAIVRFGAGPETNPPPRSEW